MGIEGLGLGVVVVGRIVFGLRVSFGRVRMFVGILLSCGFGYRRFRGRSSFVFR